jgi:hypothetical protein
MELWRYVVVGGGWNLTYEYYIARACTVLRAIGPLFNVYIMVYLLWYLVRVIVVSDSLLSARYIAQR